MLTQVYFRGLNAGKTLAIKHCRAEISNNVEALISRISLANQIH